MTNPGMQSKMGGAEPAAQVVPQYVSLPASLVALTTYPVVAVLSRLWRRPAFYFGFLTTLTVTVLREGSWSAPTPLPPVLLASLGFLAIAITKGGIGRIASTCLRNPVVFLLYVFVCSIEVLLMYYHGSEGGWVYVAGRIGFLLVLLSAAAVSKDAAAAKDIIRGMTYGVGVMGFLTLVHAMQIVNLPFGASLAPGRTFGPVQMPLPRTMGIDVSPGKVGILGAIAVSTVLLSSAGTNRIIEGFWPRVVLSVLAAAAVVITQTRGAYLAVLAAVGFSTYLLIERSRERSWFASSFGSGLVIVLYCFLLVLGNLTFPTLAPDAILNVGGTHTAENVFVRAESNAMGWKLLSRSPLLGIGHGNFIYLSFTEAGIHNHFWDQFVSAGLLGGIPYLLFHVLVLRKALMLAGQEQGALRVVSRVVCASVLAAYLGYQSFAGYFTSSLAILYGLILSLWRDAPLPGTSASS